ncbi:MAG: hypothetical protein CVU55_13955 [Deltaproteobacteria bacterium HGW-Deltaproteobacteria-13]|nr:MAG: hypothetical protein CVU55_13955 [Deltaproteobacteria bacterium HGW-Deltaproteobacteria-13]
MRTHIIIRPCIFQKLAQDLRYFLHTATKFHQICNNDVRRHQENIAFLAGFLGKQDFSDKCLTRR